MFLNASLVKNDRYEVSNPFDIDSSNNKCLVIADILGEILKKKVAFKAVPFLLHFAAVFRQRNLLNFAG